jgi:transcriptional regulator with XRE-family HTH domain
MPSSFGQKIKKLRVARQMTLDQLAEIAGASKSYIWELENREVPPQPSATKVFAIAAALGVTPEFLLSDARTEPDETVLDEAFYRKYKQLPPDMRRRLRQILDAWEENP